MKPTGLMHQAGKIYNLHQVCGCVDDEKALENLSHFLGFFSEQQANVFTKKLAAKYGSYISFLCLLLSKHYIPKTNYLF